MQALSLPARRQEAKTSAAAKQADRVPIAPEDRWLSSREAAAMLGFSATWLGAVREGRKGIEGPPFKKLGLARSAPIRYKLANIRKWLTQIPNQRMTHDLVNVPAVRTYSEREGKRSKLRGED